LHLLNHRAKGRGEGIRFAEPGWTMPGGDAHEQLAIGRRGGRRATDERRQALESVEVVKQSHPAGGRRPRPTPHHPTGGGA
jgi:hypothetical protein